MASLTVFSACQAHESNREYHYNKKIHYGRLSYALYQELSKNKQYTVKGLMDAIKVWVSAVSEKGKEQTPFYESTNENMTFKLGR